MMNRNKRALVPASEAIPIAKINLAEGDIGQSPQLSGFTSISNSFEVDN